MEDFRWLFSSNSCGQAERATELSRLTAPPLGIDFGILPMKWSYRIATIFGIPVKVHLTFLALLTILLVFGGEGEQGFSGLHLALLLCMVFVCVILHELGHSLVARHFGARIRDIVLLPIGGMARMETMPETPLKEIAMAVAGPAVSAILAGIFLVASIVYYGPAEIFQIETLSQSFLMNLFFINTALLVFNLLPAYPMDGGRVLRGLLATLLGWVTATRIAVTVGQVFAVLFVFIGLYFQLWILTLIAVFLFLGGKAEQRSVLLRWELERTPVSAVMLRQVETVTSLETLGSVAQRFCQCTQSDFPVVEGYTVVGMLFQVDLAAALQQLGPSTLVGRVMRKRYGWTYPNASLGRLYQSMATSGQRSVPVIEDGRLVGLVTLQQILKYHALGASRPVV